MKAAALLPAAESTRVLGIDETRARSVRWIQDEDGKWLRTNPWMTSLVNADPAGPGTLLGLSPGRSGASVSHRLDLQSEQITAGIEVVVIDPSAQYAAAVRRELPHARIAVDKFHLVALGNQLVTHGAATPHPGSTRPTWPTHPDLEQPKGPADRRRSTVGGAVGQVGSDVRR